MTTEMNSTFDGIKQAFAPVNDALKSFQTMGSQDATREFVKKTVNAAKDRAAEVYAGSEQVTAAIENAVTESVAETAKISRNVQQAFYQDTEAFFACIDRLASAKSINEAVQIQSDLLRANGEVFVARAKAAGDYFGKLVANSTKTAQDTFAKAYNKTA